MSTRRWVRLNVGWDDSDWIAELDALGQLAWVKLLCFVKRDGTGGRVKLPSAKVLGRRWGVPAESVEAMLEAGRKDGAIYEEGGDIVLTSWGAYQLDATAAQRKKDQRARERHGVSQ